MKIQAIETSYKSYKFRSRLEARWGVFFDAMGYKWEYEPEGYKLSDGTFYLPDFKIVSPQGIVNWYDVKPEGVDHDPKVAAFGKALNDQIISEDYQIISTIQDINILDGDPVSFFENHSDNGGICPRCGSITSMFGGGLYECSDEIWINCMLCDMDTPSGGGHPVERGLFMDCYPHKGSVMVDRGDWRSFMYIKVQSAAQKARQARFEHGRSGN